MTSHVVCDYSWSWSCGATNWMLDLLIWSERFAANWPVLRTRKRSTTSSRCSSHWKRRYTWRHAECAYVKYNFVIIKMTTIDFKFWAWYRVDCGTYHCYCSVYTVHCPNDSDGNKNCCHLKSRVLADDRSGDIAVFGRRRQAPAVAKLPQGETKPAKFTQLFIFRFVRAIVMYFLFCFFFYLICNYGINYSYTVQLT